MDDTARLSARDLRDLFLESANRKGWHPVILEKDFWVCWTLKRVFQLPAGNPPLLFKGGTSLAKAYGAIRRFSEDIDLSFDRRHLGCTDERDPRTLQNRTQREKRCDELDAAVKAHIDTVFMPQLAAVIGKELRDSNTWQLAKATTAKGHTVIFNYPQSLDSGEYGGLTYIPPAIRLELGARADHWPSAPFRVQSYAAEEFPTAFVAASCEVTVLSIERTFWEKVTILHEEYHRGEVKKRMSRHYYDVAMLADTDHGRNALGNLDLLAKVVDHKNVFHASTRANYDAARPGSLRLVPPHEILDGLATDYREMAPMFFDNPPPAFGDLLARVEALERQINGRQ